MTVFFFGGMKRKKLANILQNVQQENEIDAGLSRESLDFFLQMLLHAKSSFQAQSTWGNDGEKTSFIIAQSENIESTHHNRSFL